MQRTGVATPIPDWVDFKTKSNTRANLHNVKTKPQFTRKIQKLYAPKNKGSKCIRPKLIELQGKEKTENPITTVGDF